MDTASRIDALAERGYDDELISALLGIERADVAAFRFGRAPRPAGTVVFEVRDHVIPEGAEVGAEVPLDPSIVIGSVDVDPRRGYFQVLYMELDTPPTQGLYLGWSPRGSMYTMGEAIHVGAGQSWAQGPQAQQWSPAAGPIGWNFWGQDQVMPAQMTLQPRFFFEGDLVATQEFHVVYARALLTVF